MSVRPERMRLGDLKLLEVNARYMRPETFRALVANIERDGALTQAPFAVREPDDHYLVLSGNHRVRAAIEALGEDHEDTILVTDDKLTKQQRVAIQLSHNAISGEDDPATLKRLYESLGSVDWREYSGLDDKGLELLAPADTPALSEPDLDFQPVTMLFLPGEVEKVEAAFEEARKLIGKSRLWLARMSEYDAMLDAIDAAAKAHDVKNTATAFLLVLRVFEAHLDDLQAGYMDDEGETHKGWVPIASVLGSYDVPSSVAVIVARAVSRMVDSGEVSDSARWQALELWAADHLAG